MSVISISAIIYLEYVKTMGFGHHSSKKLSPPRFYLQLRLIFPHILIEMSFILIIIGLYVARDQQKCGNNKIFVRHISEKKYFSIIPMFCLRKTGNFKALLPVNWLTWK